ncbi:MAG: SDR family oxidoreductase [Candidatus Bilamarchaeaceae archaeon]
MNIDLRNMCPNVLVTGGAGYVGSVLVTKLLQLNYYVRTLDIYYFGYRSLSHLRGHLYFDELLGDIRDEPLVVNATSEIDCIIHLACISNDPSFDLDPSLGKSINYDAFLMLFSIIKARGVKLIIFASTSSVYGIKYSELVDEECRPNPLTDYSKFKYYCERILLTSSTDKLYSIIVRSATVCGYSPRMRLDLVPNLFINQACARSELLICGGYQFRPLIHINDITDLYISLLSTSWKNLSGKILNVGYINFSVEDLAEVIISQISYCYVDVKKVDTSDIRSYRLCSNYIKSVLNWSARFTLNQSIYQLKDKINSNLFVNTSNDINYYNIKRMSVII